MEPLLHKQSREFERSKVRLFKDAGLSDLTRACRSPKIENPMTSSEMVFGLKKSLVSIQAWASRENYRALTRQNIRYSSLCKPTICSLNMYRWTYIDYIIVATVDP